MDSLLPFLYDSFIRNNMPVYPGAYSAQPPHGKLRPPLMPDAAPPVNRYRRNSSRSNNNSAVLAIISKFSTLHQWFPWALVHESCLTPRMWRSRLSTGNSHRR